MSLIKRAMLVIVFLLAGYGVTLITDGSSVENVYPSPSEEVYPPPSDPPTPFPTRTARPFYTPTPAPNPQVIIPPILPTDNIGD